MVHTYTIFIVLQFQGSRGQQLCVLPIRLGYMYGFLLYDLRGCLYLQYPPKKAVIIIGNSDSLITFD